ncbi:serine/threonine protein kinase [Rhodococcus sp. P1Y]|uniref:serine/threonine protein kinase n=1 Tax=Rhodococcus sp. P1Y TaxID=1302308 RepID=UPI001292FD77|nr:serine/threonine protein kinase [Rhodococcus sp. P1Y]
MNQQSSRRRTTALIVVAVVAAVVVLAGIGFTVLRLVGGETGGVATAIDESLTPTKAVNSAPSLKTTGSAPSVQQSVTSAPPAPTPTLPAQPARGDLGLTVPISVPACTGTGIVVIQSAVEPASYTQEISSALAANPGASYLRTDNSCPSLRQQSDAGNPIYAVYQPAGSTTQSICAAVASAPSGSYGKWLDLTTDPTVIVAC